MSAWPGDTRAAITPQLAGGGIVAILRAAGEDHLIPVAETLAENGIRCLELTMTTPGAVDALRAARTRLGADVAIGMGSVTRSDQAAQALDAGADFLVSPAVCPPVVAAALGAGVCAYPGALTPTEVLAAWNLGAAAVKLFPASIGGPRHLKDLRGPLPDIPLIPTGGVAIDQIGAYMAAGAVAVGLGGPLLGDALDGGSLDALAQRTRAALAGVQDARRGRG